MDEAAEREAAEPLPVERWIDLPWAQPAERMPIERQGVYDVWVARSNGTRVEYLNQYADTVPDLITLLLEPDGYAVVEVRIRRVLPSAPYAPSARMAKALSGDRHASFAPREEDSDAHPDRADGRPGGG